MPKRFNANYTCKVIIFLTRIEGHVDVERERKQPLQAEIQLIEQQLGLLQRNVLVLFYNLNTTIFL
jgi:hypothetical protein